MFKEPSRPSSPCASDSCLWQFSLESITQLGGGLEPNKGGSSGVGQMKGNMVVDYKLSLLGALVIILIGGMSAIVIMSLMGASATSVTLVAGLITPSVVALLSLIRSETTAKDVGAANDTLSDVSKKVNGHLQEHSEALDNALATIKMQRAAMDELQAKIPQATPTTEVTPAT